MGNIKDQNWTSGDKKIQCVRGKIYRVWLTDSTKEEK